MNVEDTAKRHARVWAVTCHHFGYQLIVLRNIKGWSLTELSKRAHTSIKKLRDLEDGNLDGVTVLDIAKLSIAFDVAPVVRFDRWNMGPASYTEETKLKQTTKKGA